MSRFRPGLVAGIFAVLAVATAPAGAQEDKCTLAISSVEVVFEDPPVTVYESEGGPAFDGNFKAKYKGTCFGTPHEGQGCSFCASIYFQYSDAPNGWVTLHPREKHRKVEELVFECTPEAMELELELGLDVKEQTTFVFQYRVYAAAHEAPCDLDDNGNPVGQPLRYHFKLLSVTPP